MVVESQRQPVRGTLIGASRHIALNFPGDFAGILPGFNRHLPGAWRASAACWPALAERQR
jgi:hypothetical protein